MTEHPTPPLWRFIEEHLDGRSWNSLGRDLGLTGAAVRSWATGRTQIKGYQADALAGVLGVPPDDVRAVAGLPLKRTPARREMLDELERVAVSRTGFDGYNDDQLAILLDAYRRITGGDDAAPRVAPLGRRS